LALLACAPDHRRARRWIETKLWSDRAQSQASGSLRQALTEIRTCLGDHRAGLRADRRTVSLDPDVIHVSFLSNAQNIIEDLFEGLDVRDAEFERWLTTERRHFAVAKGQPEAKTLHRVKSSGDRLSLMFKDGGNQITQAMRHQISQNIQETSTVRLIGEGAAHEADMILVMTVMQDNSRQHISTQMLLADGTIAWTASRSIIGDIERDVFSISNETTEAILRTIGSHDRADPSDKLRDRAIDELFSFDPTRLRVADGLFAAAFDMRPDSLILAWQAFLRMIMINEKIESDTQGIRDEAHEMTRLALETGQDNPTLLGLISQVNLLLDFDVDGLEVLARKGAARNQGSGLAQMSLCILALRSGKSQEARVLAQRSLKSTGQGRLAHWSHMLCCLAEIAAGDNLAATFHAESAIALAPSFKPPMRHLYALDIEAGRLSRARKLLAKLRVNEPDFSLRMIREVPEYPAATLRQSGLLENRDIEVESRY